jgi:hypothetical protein
MQRRSLYTSPLQPKAGEAVDIFYNANTTNLAGRANIYVRGGWNRWMHPKPINSIRMNPAAPEIPWLKVLLELIAQGLQHFATKFCFALLPSQALQHFSPQKCALKCGSLAGHYRTATKCSGARSIFEDILVLSHGPRFQNYRPDNSLNCGWLTSW